MLPQRHFPSLKVVHKPQTSRVIGQVGCDTKMADVGTLLASTDFSELYFDQTPDTSSDAFSASMMVGRLVLADVIWGITDASTIRR